MPVFFVLCVCVGGGGVTGFRYGTKLAHVVKGIRQIRAADPTAKILLYCQFDRLKLDLRDALRAFGIGHLSLEGEPNVVRAVLGRFGDPAQQRDYVLLSSLSKKAAGTNLQIANHIVFLHPFRAPNQTTVAAWEAQAIGRCQRPGQTKQVHVHKFFSRGTIEQSMANAAEADPGQSWRTHFGAAPPVAEDHATAPSQEPAQPARSAQPVASAVPVTIAAAKQRLVRTALRSVFTAVRGDSTTVGALAAEIDRANPGVLNAAEVDVVLEVMAEDNAIMRVDNQLILI